MSDPHPEYPSIDLDGEWVPLPGFALIAEERLRQITDEGWTPDHDDQYDEGELVVAAIHYTARDYFVGVSDPWPWHESWWKPSDDPIRNLVKAGALIAAEIDRLYRAKDTT